MKTGYKFIILIAFFLPAQTAGETHLQWKDLPELQTATTNFALALVCIETLPDASNKYKKLAIEARNQVLHEANEVDVFSAEELTEIAHTTQMALSAANYNAHEENPVAQAICRGILED